MNDTYQIDDKIFRKIIPASRIASIVEELAGRINRDYAGKTPLFIIVLKGAIFFAADLLKKITLKCEIQAIRAKSYGNSMTSSGEASLSVQNLDMQGRDVIIIEDIIDSGVTLDTLLTYINSQHPASVESAVFLSKPAERTIDVPVKYLGAEIPPDFVVGYGLDYAETGRNLPDIYSWLK